MADSSHRGKRRVPAVASWALAMALVAGCGSDEVVKGGTNTNNYSCDFVASGQHKCIDTSWYNGAHYTTREASACAKLQGTPGMLCIRTNAVGGCQTIAADGDVQLVSTVWYYFGRAEDITAACATSGGDFIAP